MNDPEGILEEFVSFSSCAATGLDRWRLSGGVRTYRLRPQYAAAKRLSEARRKAVCLSKGVCPECPAGADVPVAHGRKKCAVCLARHAETVRRYRSARRPSGYPGRT